MFTTGEYSKIARVTRRTLRHYRQIGLFEPIHADQESGYYYYSIEQLPDLHRILALRDLGFTLEQIQRMTQKEIKPEELRGMLEVRKADIEKAMREELQRIRGIESRLQLLEQGIPNVEVIIKPVPEQQVLASGFLCTAPEHGLHMIADMARTLPAEVGNGKLGRMVTMLHAEHFEFVDEMVEMGYFLKEATHIPELSVNGMQFRQRTLPGVSKVASVIISGQPDEWHIGTTAIGAWLAHNNYRINGIQREIWHKYSLLDGEHHTVELQIPIAPGTQLLSSPMS